MRMLLPGNLAIHVISLLISIWKNGSLSAECYNCLKYAFIRCCHRTGWRKTATKWAKIQFGQAHFVRKPVWIHPQMEGGGGGGGYVKYWPSGGWAFTQTGVLPSADTVYILIRVRMENRWRCSIIYSVCVDCVWCIFSDINECVSDPCQNSATCKNLINAYSCTCVEGYEGTHCENGMCALHVICVDFNLDIAMNLDINLSIAGVVWYIFQRPLPDIWLWRVVVGLSAPVTQQPMSRWEYSLGEYLETFFF